MNYAEESLKMHAQWKGKIEVVAKVPVSGKQELSLAYTPGVAQPCLEIQKDVNKSYELTRRWNLCAVITDGSAVLGLGDIGPEAGMPVMEGKCVLFKAFGDVDAFPLCIKSKDVDTIVETIYLLSGSFGGVNLEDIAAPAALKSSGNSRKVRYSDLPRRPARHRRHHACQADKRPEGCEQKEGRGKNSNKRRGGGGHFYYKAAARRRI